ncbi:5-formyltetrahydrofolate cyclo-ligase [Geojedonia litorea]|uniref:5-formyltetrahydrofolate cyclo-ligase n=1 Tax=Geojedonia litorea TaxID=1268269 RepID=A0ABV9N6I7_9FLAO
MTKLELRNLYKSKRNTLSEKDAEDLSLKIANQLLSLTIWEGDFYHIFLSIIEQKEINTEYILNILSGKDKNIVVPKIDPKTDTLKSYLLTDNTTIKKNKLNIPQPIDGIEIASNTIDVVFVPLLAFDENGHRVGYGKGYYDRFLSQCKPDTLKIGLSFFYPEKPIDDVHEADVKLDYCVTPNSIYTFAS